MDKSKLYDAGQAGVFLGISRQAVDEHRIKKHIKSEFYLNVGVSGKWLYHEADLLTFIWGDFYTGRASWEHRQTKKAGNEDG